MTCFYVCKLITLISFSYLHVGCVSLLDRLIRSGRRPGSLYLTHSEPAETPTPAVRPSQHRQRTGGAERRETCDSGDKSEPMTSHGTMTALSLQCHSLQGTARSRGKKWREQPPDGSIITRPHSPPPPGPATRPIPWVNKYFAKNVLENLREGLKKGLTFVKASWPRWQIIKYNFFSCFWNPKKQFLGC